MDRRCEDPFRQAVPGLRCNIPPTTLPAVKLLLENLPASLVSEREVLRRCLEAMNAALPIQQVILFGSHARGDAGPDSNVDLCLVAEGAQQQSKASQRWRMAMSPLCLELDFSLVPISPERLAEKRASGDHFFRTVLTEGLDRKSVV